MKKNMDSKVGYGCPPRSTQFKAGKSGNPAGRPKGSRNFAAELRDELAALVPGRTGNPITKQHAIIAKLVADAMEGDAKARSTIVDHFLRTEAVDDQL